MRPVGGRCVFCVRVRTNPPPPSFLGAGEKNPVGASHVRRYGVTGNVTSPVVAETNNEEDRADVYPRSVRKRRLLGFADTTPAKPQPTPTPAPAPIPTPSVRSPSGGSSPVDLVPSREVCAYIPLLCAYLPFSSPFIPSKNAPLPIFPFFLPSSRSPLTSFFPRQTRPRVQHNRHERPSITF